MKRDKRLHTIEPIPSTVYSLNFTQGNGKLHTEHKRLLYRVKSPTGVVLCETFNIGHARKIRRALNSRKS